MLAGANHTFTIVSVVPRKSRRQATVLVVLVVIMVMVEEEDQVEPSRSQKPQTRPIMEMFGSNSQGQEPHATEPSQPRATLLIYVSFGLSVEN